MLRNAINILYNPQKKQTIAASAHTIKRTAEDKGVIPGSTIKNIITVKSISGKLIRSGLFFIFVLKVEKLLPTQVLSYSNKVFLKPDRLLKKTMLPII